MRWLITLDHIAEDERENRAFKAGNTLGAEAQAAMLHTPGAQPFRLFDDDGGCYYEGLLLEEEGDDPEHILWPLDWAMGYAGCTYMEMLNPKSGKWEAV